VERGISTDRLKAFLTELAPAVLARCVVQGCW